MYLTFIYSIHRQKFAIEVENRHVADSMYKQLSFVKHQFLTDIKITNRKPKDVVFLPQDMFWSGQFTKLWRTHKVEITEGDGDYPTHVHNGYVGFDNYESAVSFAKAVNGRTVLLYKQDGRHFWKSRGEVYGPIDLTEDHFGDGYRLYYSRQQYIDDRKEGHDGRIADGASAEEIAEYDAITMETLENFEPDFVTDCIVVTFEGGKFFQKYFTPAMEYGYDTYFYAIGVIKED